MNPQDIAPIKPGQDGLDHTQAAELNYLRYFAAQMPDVYNRVIAIAGSGPVFDDNLQPIVTNFIKYPDSDSGMGAMGDFDWMGAISKVAEGASKLQAQRAEMEKAKLAAKIALAQSQNDLNYGFSQGMYSPQYYAQQQQGLNNFGRQSGATDYTMPLVVGAGLIGLLVLASKKGWI